MKKAVAIVFLTALAACGGGAKQEAGGSSGGITIAVIPKGTSHVFWQSIHAGAQKAATDLGVTIVWRGPLREDDRDAQVSEVEGFISRGISGICIAPLDETALVPPVQEAVRQKIPVVIFDSGLKSGDYVSFVATDNYGAGCTAARTLAALIGNNGKVGMVMHKPGGTSTVLREQGFEATIAKEFPGIVIAARQFGMSDRARSRAAAENILTAHPDLAGLFASSEPSSLGSIQAVRSRGLSGKIRLVTFDFSDAHVEALKDGVIDVMLVQDPFRIGYEAVKSLAEKLRGRMPQKRLDLPARVIVKRDLDKPEVQALLFPDWLKGK